MLTKTNKKIWQILWLGTLFCFIGILFAIPCSAQNAPKGEATILFFSTFQMNGGDCHTSIAGSAVQISNLIYDGLVKKNPDGHIVPALAKSWKIAKDGLTIKFTINERAKFHNGEPVTAEDVKFSIERAMRPELKYRGRGELINKIDRIEVTDKHNLTVYFKAPCPAFMELSYQHLGIVPKAYVEKVGDAEFAKHPIGAGPFKWIDYQQDVFINVEAVPDHYRQVPHVKIIHGKFLSEVSTVKAMLMSGEADVAQLPGTSFVEVQNDPKFKVVWAKFAKCASLLFFDLAYPQRPSPFHDVRVRRATSLAINRKAICENVLQGAADPWVDIIAPYQLGYSPDLKPNPYDPEKAKALLKEAGYPNGFDTIFNLGYSQDKLEVQAMAADLAKVGIRAKLIEFESLVYVRNAQEKKFQGLGRFPNPFWAGYSHPAVALESFLSLGTFWSYFVTPQVDAAWKKLSVQTDEKGIAAQAKETSRVWRESEIGYLLWAIHQPFGLSPRVKSYQPTPGNQCPVGLEFLELF
jgi:peptide/nickel transport system substrate-binding protein